MFRKKALVFAMAFACALVITGGTPVTGTEPSGPGDLSVETIVTRANRVAYYQGGEEGFFLMSGPEAPPWSPALQGFRVTESKAG